MAKKKTDGPERLPITPGTVKKLFAYSGNRCAFPGCKEDLVDDGGTMLGKVAHIHAAKNGARYDAAMTDEQRRDFSNLFVVCGKHHDIIDDPAREMEFPATDLRKWKDDHEAKFKRAERDFINRYRDLTALTEPTFPKTLYALSVSQGNEADGLEADSVADIREFVERLRHTPPDVRGFALSVARRMKNRKKKRLAVEDVSGAFDISTEELARLGIQLEDHHLGYIDDVWGNGANYELVLHDREWGGNPFIEMIEFCEKTGVDSDRLLYDLDFALYDEVR